MIRFGIIADSHYADRTPQLDRHYRESKDKMLAAVSLMNQKEVDFLLHLGDLKDEDEQRQKEDTLQYLMTIETLLQEFDGPVYHCIGNHDMDSISKQDFLNNISNEGQKTAENYYAFDFNPYRFIVLDTNFDQNNQDKVYNYESDWEDTIVSDDQIEWLKETIASSPYSVIIFSHHPVYKYEDKNYEFHISNYKLIQSIISKSGIVKAVLQGHVHAEDHELIDQVHYITFKGMIEYSGLENNAFYICEIKDGYLSINGFGRASDMKLTL